MKSSVFLSALSGAALVAALPQHGGHGAQPSNGGIKIEELKSHYSSQYKRVRVTYGTYDLAPFNAPAKHGGMDMGMAMPGMEHEGGMLDASNKKAPKPCSDCTLKYAMAYVTYPDGKTANIESGTYLHHLTMSVVGPGREDLACPGGTKRIPKNMERMLAIHNDRNETFFGVNALDKMGFYLGKDDVIDLELMLKNELNVPKQMVFSIEWEFIPGRPKGWSQVKGLWMDAAPCSAMVSDIEPPKGKSKFTLTGPAWSSSVNGRLLNTVGHMHDGGTEVQILLNNQPVCKSLSEYDGAGYVPSAQAVAQGAPKISHISRYTPCIAIGQLKRGDKLALSASYDFDKWKPALNKIGDKSHVMGIAMLFVEIQS